MSRQWIKVLGRVVALKEEAQDVMHLYYTIKNFYPVIGYEYSVDGQVFTGTCGRESARRYRVAEIDQWGSKRNDQAFFWRQLSIGDSVPIQVDCSRHDHSRLAIPPTQMYRSERKALAVGLLLVVIATLAVLGLLIR